MGLFYNIPVFIQLFLTTIGLYHEKHRENTSENLRQHVKNNPNFMEVVDDLIEMVADLKDMVDYKRQTTSKPAYEMIYREFL
jgi:hypothetical protein